MNERQHDLSVAASRAQSEARLARHSYESKRAEAADATKALQAAIDADPTSWYGTPGMESKHGLSLYKNVGCRCSVCKKAARENQQRYRAERRRIGRPPNHVHGTTNGYQNYGCRCDDCRSAQAESNAAHYASSSSEAQS